MVREDIGYGEGGYRESVEREDIGRVWRVW